MARLLLAAALLSALQGAAGLQVDARAAECSHDRQSAFESLRNGSGSLWLFHVTHNAGTSLLRFLGDNLERSTLKNHDDRLRAGDLEPGHFYYGVAGEIGLRAEPFQSQMPCESDRFVSVFPVRDPLPRILTGDGSFTTTAYNNTDGCNTQNYGLRKLIGKDFRQPLTAQDVEFAKRRIASFDIILDVATLEDSVASMCVALGFQKCDLHKASGHGVKTSQEVLEEVGPAVYSKWRERNAPEIELYEYAQKLAADFVRKYPSPRPPQEVGRAQEAEDRAGSDRWICGIHTTP